MKYSRRAVLYLSSLIGVTGTASANENSTEDDSSLTYGTVPYSEQGYGGLSADCFIATAACGTSDHKDVIELRDFRDATLQSNVVGRLGVYIYYILSPPVAKWVSREPRRRKIVRRTIIQPASKLVQKLN